MTTTLVTRKKISDSLKTYYIEHPEAREKIRLSRTGRGHRHTLATRRQMSLSRKKLWKQVAYRAHFEGRKHKPDTYTESVRKQMSLSASKRMLRNDRYHSKLEDTGRKLLKEFGWERRVRLGNHTYDGGSIQDRIVIEIDGCWYHSHGCELGSSNFPTNDKRRKAIALAKDYTLVVLRECRKTFWRKTLNVASREITARMGEMELEGRSPNKKRRTQYK